MHKKKESASALAVIPTLVNFSLAKNSKILLTLIIAFLALGCVQKEVKTDPNDGLKISEFFIDRDDVESDDSFRIHALVENVGGTTARLVDFEVFGITWVRDKVFLFTNKDLTPPDVFRNKAGGAAFGQKTFTAPQLPEGLTHTFSIIGRATYGYSTSGCVSIPVFSKAEFDRNKIKGEALPTMTLTNSDAPIKIDISGSVPIIADSGELFYKIHLNNVGSGVPITKDSTGKEITGLVTGEIKISGGAEFAECLGFRGSTATLPADKTKGILLRRGESIDIPCSIRLNTAYWQNRVQGAILLLFDLKYGYFTEKEALLTVHGRRFEPGVQPVDITQPLPTPTLPTPSPIAPTCGVDIVGECKITCSTTEYADLRYSCPNVGEACCIAVSGAQPTDCGFLPSSPECYFTYPLLGLYRSGDTQPFGNWCSNIVYGVETYYECISGCPIDVGPYGTPLDPPAVPQENECR